MKYLMQFFRILDPFLQVLSSSFPLFIPSSFFLTDSPSHRIRIYLFYHDLNYNYDGHEHIYHHHRKPSSSGFSFPYWGGGLTSVTFLLYIVSLFLIFSCRQFLAHVFSNTLCNLLLNFIIYLFRLSLNLFEFHNF